jgi:hypothetical protein
MDYNCNQGGSAKGQVGRGPTVGNGSLGAKRTEFIAEKESFQAAATEITARYGERGRDTTGHIGKNDDSIKPNVNVGRGPTRGNK